MADLTFDVSDLTGGTTAKPTPEEEEEPQTLIPTAEIRPAEGTPVAAAPRVYPRQKDASFLDRTLGAMAVGVSKNALTGAVVRNAIRGNLPYWGAGGTGGEERVKAYDSAQGIQ